MYMCVYVYARVPNNIYVLVFTNVYTLMNTIDACMRRVAHNQCTHTHMCSHVHTHSHTHTHIYL